MGNLNYTCTSANRKDGGTGYLASPSLVTSCVYGNKQSTWKRVERVAAPEDYPEAAVTQSTCDSGWTYFGDHCYKRMRARRYDAAQSVCTGYSGYIAVPNTIAENTFLFSTMNPSGVAYTWIGFDYKNRQQWEDGTDSSMSSSWRVLYSVHDAAARKRGQPVTFMRRNGAWSFDPKSYRFEYVCEKPGKLSGYPSSQALTSCGGENAPGKPINSLKECVAAWQERGVEVKSSVQVSESDLPTGCSIATAEGSYKTYAGRVFYNKYSCLPTRGDGRCGPSYGGAACASSAGPYCNEATGRCGITAAHKWNGEAPKKEWKKYNSKNCYNNKGAVSLGLAAVGISADACKKRCMEKSGCDCIVFSSGQCHLRKQCVINKCAGGNYQAYIYKNAPHSATYDFSTALCGNSDKAHTWGLKLLCDCTGNSPAHRKIPLSWCSVQYGQPDAVTCSTFETYTKGKCGFSPAVRMHRNVYYKPRGINDFGSRMSPQLGNVMCYKANPVTLAPTSSPTTVEPTIGTTPPTIAPTEWPWATNFTLQDSSINTCSVGQIDITESGCRKAVFSAIPPGSTPNARGTLVQHVGYDANAPPGCSMRRSKTNTTAEPYMSLIITPKTKFQGTNYCNQLGTHLFLQPEIEKLWPNLVASRMGERDFSAWVATGSQSGCIVNGANSTTTVAKVICESIQTYAQTNFYNQLKKSVLCCGNLRREDAFFNTASNGQNSGNWSKVCEQLPTPAPEV